MSPCSTGSGSYLRATGNVVAAEGQADRREPGRCRAGHPCRELHDRQRRHRVAPASSSPVRSWDAPGRACAARRAARAGQRLACSAAHRRAHPVPARHGPQRARLDGPPAHPRRERLHRARDVDRRPRARRDGRPDRRAVHARPRGGRLPPALHRRRGLDDVHRPLRRGAHDHARRSSPPSARP